MTAPVLHAGACDQGACVVRYAAPHCAVLGADAALCCAVLCSARERAVWVKMTREASSMATKACYCALLLRDR
jgi:hypothetical protein